jgi:hypothetical protein
MGNWSDEFKGNITVCNRKGVIVYINKHANNGKDLLGSNLLDCHPELALSKVESMLRTPTLNTCTVEKGGRKKIVHQCPNLIDGVFSVLLKLHSKFQMKSRILYGIKFHGG